jgi:hypothetical protein
MRLLSQLLVIFVISLIAIALPSVPAQAICVPWDIEFSPQSAPPGTEVTVHGYEFAAGKPIDIYYDGILVSEGTETDNNGEFNIAFIVPEGCNGYYHVHADVEYAEADAYFQVKPGLTVSPGKGAVGTNVTVKGQGFAKNEEGIELMYYLNGSYKAIEGNIVANSKGSWETSFRIPFSTRGEHKIDAEGDESWLWEVQETTFTVTGDISIDESSGIVGDTITMSGIKFAANEKGITILFDDQAVVTDIKANSEGEWEESFQVPQMPAGEYSVTAEGEQTKKEDIGELSFEIEPNILLSLDQGHAGMNLTVTGHGFAASEDINIMYDDNQKATATTNDQGSFDVSFLVPESKYGEHTVTVGYDAGNAASAVFIMESNPPDTPTPISPDNRSRLGFMGGVMPTFEWSEVSDDSGVHYRLQIATSDNVTATGEFVDPLVSVAGLAGTSYTLTEALPYDAYYWIVQAVDGAENEGDWSAPRSFRVGLLPLWALILILVAAAMLLILLIRALITRRSIYYDHW